MSESKRAAVIGGGISGLACAYRLQQLGVRVTLIEAAPKAGGLIGSVEKDGFLFESGPQSFQGTELLLGLARELGIGDELSRADPGAPRYVLRHGKLQKIPMSPQAVLGSSLLGIGSRLKIAWEPLRRTKPPSEEESVAAFVRRKFGHEILEYLVAPFVSGVYAGDPEKLSLRAAFPSLDEWEREYGSVLRGAVKSRSGKRSGPPALCSFRLGMATLTGALATALGDNVLASAPVASFEYITDSGGAPFRLGISRHGRVESLDTQAAIFATPAYTAAHLLRQTSPSLADMLSGIAYAGVAVVAAGYYAKQVAQPLEGFGVLIPRSEHLHTLGTVWNSSLFPGRARDGGFTITSFIGGATDPEILCKTDSEIEAIVQAEAEKTIGITGLPVASAAWKHSKALPQYNLGHGHVVEAIGGAEKNIPGLFFSGNYLEGPSLGKCVEHSFKTAEAVKAHLEARE